MPELPFVGDHGKDRTAATAISQALELKTNIDGAER